MSGGIRILKQYQKKRWENWAKGNKNSQSIIGFDQGIDLTVSFEKKKKELINLFKADKEIDYEIDGQQHE